VRGVERRQANPWTRSGGKSAVKPQKEPREKNGRCPNVQKRIYDQLKNSQIRCARWGGGVWGGEGGVWLGSGTSIKKRELNDHTSTSKLQGKRRGEYTLRLKRKRGTKKRER